MPKVSTCLDTRPGIGGVPNYNNRCAVTHTGDTDERTFFMGLRKGSPAEVSLMEMADRLTCSILGTVARQPVNAVKIIDC